jgi:hypothetical protein
VANLVQNALKFTQPRTTVTIRAGAGAERVLIEVQDHCGGFATESVDELFHPFEQRGSDRTGLGLGLAFSRWGAEANGGRVYARESTRDWLRLHGGPAATSGDALCSGLTEMRFRQAFLLLLVAAISVAFVTMIRAFW